MKACSPDLLVSGNPVPYLCRYNGSQWARNIFTSVDAMVVTGLGMPKTVITDRTNSAGGSHTTGKGCSSSLPLLKGRRFISAGTTMLGVMLIKGWTGPPSREKVGLLDSNS